MFTTLIKRLFKKRSKKASNLYYFEESNPNKANNALQWDKVSTTNISSQKNKSLPFVPKSFEQEYQLAFYDFLLGKSNNSSTESHDELSHVISEKIEQLIQKPELILDALPILPASLTTVVEQLNNHDFDTDSLVELLQREPAIAAKVIELANSSYYNRSKKPITDLKSAFMALGVNGLSEGVINGFIAKLIPQSSIYFQQYGKKIWQHSLNTGVIAKLLIEKTLNKHLAPQAYLVGLLCNLGNIIIYQLLIDAFLEVHPDCQPSSTLFKNVMAKNAKRLTYFIAKHWQFPQELLDTLAVQAKLKKSSLLPALHQKMPLACYIYEAKVISELQMRAQFKKLDKDYIDEVSTSLLYSNEARDYLKALSL